MTSDIVLTTARAMSFVREVPLGSNAGRWVEAIQRVGNTYKGQPWCAAFVTFVLGVAFKDKPPIPYTASCDAILKCGERWEWIVESPEPGDVFLVMRTPTDAIHTGFVVSVQGGFFNTIEGNTSDPGRPATREGWGVFARTRKLDAGKYRFVRYPRSV